MTHEDPKRWELSIVEHHGWDGVTTDAKMVEESDGRFVTYEDYLALSAKLEEVTEELASNRACNLFTWKERAQKAEAKLEEVQAELKEANVVKTEGWVRYTSALNRLGIAEKALGWVVTVDVENASRGEIVKACPKCGN